MKLAAQATTETADRTPAQEATRAGLASHLSPRPAGSAPAFTPLLDLTAVRAQGRRGAPEEVHGTAAEGLRGASQPLPHLEPIQRSFGRHGELLGDVAAHVGGPARAAARALGALAFASGDRVAFQTAPDLHTAAHEAAHVVQQRGGLRLPGGVGATGDRHERHADAVADAVVAGRSAEALLGPLLPARPASAGASAVQFRDAPDLSTSAATGSATAHSADATPEATAAAASRDEERRATLAEAQRRVRRWFSRFLGRGSRPSLATGQASRVAYQDDEAFETGFVNNVPLPVNLTIQAINNPQDPAVRAFRDTLRASAGQLGAFTVQRTNQIRVRDSVASSELLGVLIHELLHTLERWRPNPFPLILREGVTQYLALCALRGTDSPPAAEIGSGPYGPHTTFVARAFREIAGRAAMDMMATAFFKNRDADLVALANFRVAGGESIGWGIFLTGFGESWEWVRGAPSVELDPALGRMSGPNVLGALLSGRKRLEKQANGGYLIKNNQTAAPAGAPASGAGASSRAGGQGPSAGPVQRRSSEGRSPPGEDAVHRAAALGLSGSPGTLPHLRRIEDAFGAYGPQLHGVGAHVGGPAAEASRTLSAVAYTRGDAIAFASAPDLHTAAHEAAHVIQQRRGVQLAGGIDEAGDRYERHADRVADAVVAGRSAEGLLRELAGPPDARAEHAAPAVQRRSAAEDDARTATVYQLLDQDGARDEDDPNLGGKARLLAEWVQSSGATEGRLAYVLDRLIRDTRRFRLARRFVDVQLMTRAIVPGVEVFLRISSDDEIRGWLRDPEGRQLLGDFQVVLQESLRRSLIFRSASERAQLERVQRLGDEGRPPRESPTNFAEALRGELERVRGLQVPDFPEPLREGSALSVEDSSVSDALNLYPLGAAGITVVGRYLVVYQNRSVVLWTPVSRIPQGVFRLRDHWIGRNGRLIELLPRRADTVEQIRARIAATGGRSGLFERELERLAAAGAQINRDIELLILLKNLGLSSAVSAENRSTREVLEAFADGARRAVVGYVQANSQVQSGRGAGEGLRDGIAARAQVRAGESSVSGAGGPGRPPAPPVSGGRSAPGPAPGSAPPQPRSGGAATTPVPAAAPRQPASSPAPTTRSTGPAQTSQTEASSTNIDRSQAATQQNLTELRASATNTEQSLTATQRNLAELRAREARTQSGPSGTQPTQGRQPGSELPPQLVQSLRTRHSQALNDAAAQGTTAEQLAAYERVRAEIVRPVTLPDGRRIEHPFIADPHPDVPATSNGRPAGTAVVFAGVGPAAVFHNNRVYTGNVNDSRQFTKVPGTNIPRTVNIDALTPRVPPSDRPPDGRPPTAGPPETR